MYCFKCLVLVSTTRPRLCEQIALSPGNCATFGHNKESLSNTGYFLSVAGFAFSCRAAYFIWRISILQECLPQKSWPHGNSDLSAIYDVWHVVSRQQAHILQVFDEVDTVVKERGAARIDMM